MPTVNATGMLAVGGPSFDAPALSGQQSSTSEGAANAASGPGATRGTGSGCGSLQNLRFQSLEGTLQEVQELSRVWGDPGTPQPGPARVLVGQQASETTLKHDAHQYRVLHLATHGFFLGSGCSRCRRSEHSRCRRTSRGAGAVGEPAAALRPRPRRRQPPRVGRSRRGRRHPHGRRGGVARSERRRVGRALRVRHRRRRNPRRRRRVRPAPRVSGRRRPHRRDEPVVGGRSGDAGMDAGALRGTLPAQAVHRRCRARKPACRCCGIVAPRGSARIRSTGRRSSPPATGDSRGAVRVRTMGEAGVVQPRPF